MQQLSRAVFERFPTTLLIAEESTAWLYNKTYLCRWFGHNYKWNMGWMNDSLKYMQIDLHFRQWRSPSLDLLFMYAY